MGKVDELRALRERRYDESQKSAKSASAHRVTNVNNAAPKPPGKKSSAQRQAKWREANPDLNRERARKGMRKKRASEKHP